MTHQPTRYLAVVLAASILLASLPAATAASDDGVMGDLFDGEDDSTLESLLSAAEGLVNRFTESVGSTLDGGESASTSADNLRSAFNSQNQTLETWSNSRTNASESWDVLELEFEADGESESVFVTADVNSTSGDYQNSSVVESTSRDVDEECTLEGHAARNADEELDRFVEEFAESNSDVNQSYLSRLAGEYGGSVDCSFSLRKP